MLWTYGYTDEIDVSLINTKQKPYVMIIWIKHKLVNFEGINYYTMKHTCE